MNDDQTMEKLLSSARSLPTELAYNEVEFLFLNPTPPPPARPWWQGGYPKFLLMLTLLIALVGFLLPTQANIRDYQLSAFPVQENTHSPISINPLPKGGTISLSVPQREMPTLRPIISVPGTLAPTTMVAPAHSASSVTTAAPKETQIERPTPPLSQPAPDKKINRGAMPPALFQGNYAFFRGDLMLSFQESPNPTKDEPVDLLYLELTKAEQRTLKSADGQAQTIKRAAGTLMLFPNGKKGTFEYLANDKYQQMYSERGWAPKRGKPQQVFTRTTLGKLDELPPVKRLQDQLWFRYFTTDINDAYLAQLREFGYKDTDFSELWQLVNVYLDYEEASTVLKLAQATLTGLPSLAELSKLKYYVDELTEVSRSGKKMTYAEFESLRTQPSFWELLAKAEPPEASIPVADKYIANRKSERELNFSTGRPGTVKEVIPYDGKTKLELFGNFEFRINKDTTEHDILVYGPENLVMKLRRKSDYTALRLKHKNKKQALFIEFPRGAMLLHRPQKGVTMEVNTKRKGMK